MQLLSIQWITIALVFNHFLPRKNCQSCNYQNFDQWKEVSSQCGGNRQSPVNINPDEVIPELDGNPLKFNGYNQIPKTMTLENNGHTVALTAVWPKGKPIISGGPLNGQYFLESLHFHWGLTSSKGSEHTISNQSFPLEMHMVHVSTKYNSSSIAVAQNQDEGLSVIGILFDIDKTEGSTLAPLITSINKVKSIDDKTRVPPFPLSVFGLSQVKEFYTYQGSLTIPPCSENVIWLLPTTTRKVVKSQVQVFRKVSLDNGDEINCRPTQPLNDRMVRIIKGSACYYLTCPKLPHLKIDKVGKCKILPQNSPLVEAGITSIAINGITIQSHRTQQNLDMRMKQKFKQNFSRDTES